MCMNVKHRRNTMDVITHICPDIKYTSLVNIKASKKQSICLPFHFHAISCAKGWKHFCLLWHSSTKLIGSISNLFYQFICQYLKQFIPLQEILAIDDVWYWTKLGSLSELYVAGDDVTWRYGVSQAMYKDIAWHNCKPRMLWYICTV